MSSLSPSAAAPGSSSALQAKPLARSVRIALLAGAAVLVVIGVAAQALTDAKGTWTDMTDAVFMAVVFVPVGLFIVSRVPTQPVGRLLLAIGLVASLAAATSSGNGPLAAVWIGSWAWWPGYGLFPLALLRFPDGELPSAKRRWRWIARCGWIGVAGATIGLALAGIVDRRALLVSLTGEDIGAAARTLISIATVFLALSAVALVGSIAGLVSRWRRATAFERRQLGLLLVAAVVAAVGVVLDNLAIPGAWALAVAPIPIAMGVAILRHQLYDLDVFLNRSLVYAGLAGVLLTCWAAVVIAAESVLDAGPELTALAGAAVVAVLVQPVHARLRRSVDRALFGERSEPYAVVSSVARQYASPRGAADDVLTDVATAVAESLRLPYVGISLSGPDAGRREAVAIGRLTQTPIAFPLRYRGQSIGALEVCPRSVGDRFTADETTLLRELATHIAVTAHVVGLADDLGRSREGLVRAREEERKRLRRELHDGLGASLAGVSMMVGAVSSQVSNERQRTTLAEIERNLGDLTGDLRLLIDDMRPAALDDVGLVDALRRQGTRFATPGNVRIEVRGDASLSERPLPAAVEVAAYRIATEAISNAVRHADAATCTVDVTTDGELLNVTVADDGHGRITPRADGVGLDAMRERARELGGDCTWDAVPDSGTSVQCRIPLALG